MELLQYLLSVLVTTVKYDAQPIAWDILLVLTSVAGNCCDIGQIDIFSRIELIPPFVLSSDNTNYKNDIQ